MSAVRMEQEYTTEEVAARLRVHRLTVIRRIEAGVIPARKEGREWRIKASDLEAYIQSTYPAKNENQEAE
jgi:excisionase family DNA binding protein